MKNWKKNEEYVVLKAKGVDEERFVVQWNKEAPHIRLYERKKRGPITIHKRVNEFYKMKKAIQCAYVLSEKQ